MKDEDNDARTGREGFMSLLKRLRLERGLTQTALAARMNLVPSTVSFWESGESVPKPALIPKLARVLGVHPREIVNAISPVDPRHVAA